MPIGDKRQVRRIQEVLDAKRMRFADVHRAVGIPSYHTVWATMHGRKNNRKVLRYLLALGVPAEVLDLPRDLQAEISNRSHT